MRENQDRSRPRAAGGPIRLGELSWAFMLRGVLAAVLGLCALIWPRPQVSDSRQARSR
jgi:uncharacterized membrane protein HdeD (DUF308 family)